MNIKITERDNGKEFDMYRFQADCMDLPGSPPVAYAPTKERAVGMLFLAIHHSTYDLDGYCDMTILNIEDVKNESDL